MVLRAVVMDLDGVLRRWDAAVIGDAEAVHGLPAGALGAVVFEPGLLSAAVTGRVSDGQWREQVAGALAVRFGRAAAAGAVSRWSASAGEVDEEVLAVVRGLRGQCRVALLSNATTRLRADLDRLGLMAVLDEVFSSAELGLAKPDPEVFRVVCARLGVAPAECGLVDDTAGHVRAAEAVGLVGHRYVSPAGLVGFLTDCGVSIA